MSQHNNNNQNRGNNNYQGRGPAPSRGGSQSKPSSNKLFNAFANKNGNGFSVQVKEDIVIKAGTRIGVFPGTVGGKDGKPEYQVMSVTVLPDRD